MASLVPAGLVVAAGSVQAPTMGTRDSKVRLIAAPSQRLDSTMAAALVRIVDKHWVVPGLPAAVLRPPITVRLSLDMAPSKHGMALPERGELHLPADATQWRPEDQERVIRHELAHIALATFVNHKPLPAWFNEGFAIWAAGGPTCKDELRIRFDMVTRVRAQKPQPSLYGVAFDTPDPLAAQYYGLFFAYLEERGNKAVSDGSLLRAVKARGIQAGLVEVLGVSLAVLEADWQRHLTGRLGEVPANVSCLKAG